MKKIELNKGKIKIYNGDALSVLKTIKDKEIQTIITSPPYWGLREYELEQPLIWGGDSDCNHEWETIKGTKAVEYYGGKQYSMSANGPKQTFDSSFCKKCGCWFGHLGLEPSPELYLDHLMLIIDELWRVLRDDGTFFLNIGDTYWGGKGQSSYAFQEHRTSPSIEGKAHNIKSGIKETRPQDGKHRYIKPKSLCLIPQKLAIRCQEAGWIIRNEVIWHKPNPMPSSAKDRFTVSHEQIWFMTKNNKPIYWQHEDGKVVWKKPSPDYTWIHKDTNEEHPFPPSTEDKENWKRINLWSSNNYYWDQDAVREAFDVPRHAPGNKARKGILIQHEKRKDKKGASPDPSLDPNRTWGSEKGRNKRDVWTIPTQAFKEAHFAVFPEKLIEPCILVGSSHKACPHCRAPWVRMTKKQYPKTRKVKSRTPPGQNAQGLFSNKRFDDTIIVQTIGFLPTCNCKNNDGSGGCIVLDPFFGSGTVGVVCKQHDRHCKGIEPGKQYFDMSIKRINKGTKVLKERKDSSQNYIDHWFDNC